MSENSFSMMDENSDFFSAIKKGNLDFVTSEAMARPQLLSSVDKNGLTALLISIYHDQKDITTFLINSGATLNLFEACAAGDLEQVKTILAHQPDLLNSFSTDGFQPLGLAAFFGHAGIVYFLLGLGAQVNSPSRNNLQVSSLNSAAAGDHLEVVKLLLGYGADPNIPQADGFVPLHAAAQNGDLAMAETLLAYGADPDRRNIHGKTALNLAMEIGNSSLIELLVKK